MKLAEALMLRADLKKKYLDLMTRAQENASVYEGQTPPESVLLLLTEADNIRQELNEQIVKINAANQKTVMPDGRTLSAWITDKDSVSEHRNQLKQVVKNAAGEKRFSFGREKLCVATFSIADLQKTIDFLSSQVSYMEREIQKVNWVTDYV